MDLFQHNVIKINVKSVLLTQYITSRLQLIMLCARLRIVWRENEDFQLICQKLKTHLFWQSYPDTVL